MKALEGVGDATLGEWEERGENAYHVKRRLSAAEEEIVGVACDIRRTFEARERLHRAWAWLRTRPALVRQFAQMEVEGLL